MHSGQRDLPEALQLRVKFENQDFFLPQSLADADNIKTLFIRQCLHNWANEDVVKILGSFSELLKTSDEISLLINDTVIPVHGEVFPHEEFYTLQFDLIMMLYMNARQRSLAEWTSLAKQANPHYEVVDDLLYFKQCADYLPRSSPSHSTSGRALPVLSRSSTRPDSRL